MRRVVKQTHLYGASAAKGGWAQMAPADYGRAGREIRDQYAYLRNFAREIASGKQAMDGTLGWRAQLYAQSGRSTYHAIEQVEMRAAGMKEERNRMTPGAKHCDGCRSESSRGWVPIGTLVRVGHRKCNHNDKCWLEYR